MIYQSHRRLGEKDGIIRVNRVMTCSFLPREHALGLLRSIRNNQSGCSAIGNSPRENLQIAFFSASFVPIGASPIQCNSRPVMTRKGLGRLDKDLKTN